jgi:paraquat-inducible protein B
MVFDGSPARAQRGRAGSASGRHRWGRSQNIDLILDAEEGDLIMMVEAEIDANNVQLHGAVDSDMAEELVRRGLRAQLNLQSLLTGLLYIQLDFKPETPARLVDVASELAQIPTIPTELEQLRSSLEKVDYAAITESLDHIARSLDTLLSSDEAQGLPGAMQDTLAAVERASVELESALKDNSDRLARLLDEGGQAVAQLNTRLPQMAESLTNSLDKLDGALASAQTSLVRLEQAAAPDSPPRQQLSGAMQELSLAARALRSLALSLEENPQALLRGRQETEPQ